MTKRDSAQLLALIKLSYPTAYRDLDEASISATINMWHMSFPDVPYPVMEQALNRYRLTNKFPPTVAEMVEELRHLHYQAVEQASIQQTIGNHNVMKQWLLVMDYTRRYKDTRSLGEMTMGTLMGMQLEAPAYRQALPEGEEACGGDAHIVRTAEVSTPDFTDYLR